MLSTITLPLAIALLALTQVQINDTNDRICLTSRAFGKTYTSCVTHEAIRKSPAWDQKSESPPVSPKKAIELAQKMRKLVAKAPDGVRWRVVDLNLFFSGGDHCAWRVTFRASELDPGLINSYEVALIVLMDGAVIKPTVADEKPKK